MIRTIITIILFLSISYLVHAQDDDVRLDSFSSVYTTALEQEDFDLLISLTHPDVISIAGGLEYAKQDLMRDAQEYNRMQLRNYYLAASLDGGETWTFLDLRKHDAQSIPLFVPAYDGRLNIFLE